MCRQVRAAFPELYIHSKYILDTWRKIKRFKMLTTGDDMTDHECRRMFGPWIKWSCNDEFLLAVCSEIVQRYELGMPRAVNLVEKNHLLILAGPLNGAIARLAMEANLNVRDRSDQDRKHRRAKAIPV